MTEVKAAIGLLFVFIVLVFSSGCTLKISTYGVDEVQTQEVMKDKAWYARWFETSRSGNAK